MILECENEVLSSNVSWIFNLSTLQNSSRYSIYTTVQLTSVSRLTITNFTRDDEGEEDSSGTGAGADGVRPFRKGCLSSELHHGKLIVWFLPLNAFKIDFYFAHSIMLLFMFSIKFETFEVDLLSWK